MSRRAEQAKKKANADTRLAGSLVQAGNRSGVSHGGSSAKGGKSTTSLYRPSAGAHSASRRSGPSSTRQDKGKGGIDNTFRVQVVNSDLFITTLSPRGEEISTVRRLDSDVEWINGLIRNDLFPGCILPLPPSALGSAYDDRSDRKARQLMFIRRYVYGAAPRPADRGGGGAPPPQPYGALPH